MGFKNIKAKTGEMTELKNYSWKRLRRNLCLTYVVREVNEIQTEKKKFSFSIRNLRWKINSLTNLLCKIG